MGSKRNYIIAAIVAVTIIGAILLYRVFAPVTAPAATSAYLFVDITDPDTGRLRASSIIGTATNGRNINDAITVHVETLSPYHHNTVQEFKLPKESLLLGNPTIRKRSVQALTKQLDTTLLKMYAEQNSKEQSNIFEPILTAANELSTSNTSRKVIIVSSDLQENTPLFSYFKKADSILLKTNPDEVERILLNGTPVKDLKGVTIYLIHTPRSLHDDDLFNQFAKLYKRFYEKHHAVVIIQNNLID